MNSELGIHHNGSLVLVCSADIPGTICRLEYYREQKMLSIVYENNEIDPDLSHYEMPEDVDTIMRKKGLVTVIVSPNAEKEAYGYDVPIVQIGL